MAYVPPYKRHSMALERLFPSPERLLNFRPFKPQEDRSGQIAYGNDAISVWCAVGLDGDNQFPSSLYLKPISVEAIERKTGEKPLVLLNRHPANENDEMRGNVIKTPWEFLAETIWPDLLSSSEVVKREMECQKLEEVKPTLVARLGKILFNSSNSVCLESLRRHQVAETTLRQLKRLFYTNIPSIYMENITSTVVPKIGLEFEEEKDTYHVKLSDIKRPDTTISCKCCVKEDRTLELYKVELNQVRHLVVDVSCFDKDVDLRLMLCSKRILTALSDDEKHCIRNLINSAVIDPEVKGGLRWPVGLAYFGNRYRVVGIWHTKVKSYRNSSLRLKVRYADRFNYKTATGEASMEIILKLKRIVSEIQEAKLEYNSIYGIFRDTLRLIWNNFLCRN